MAPYKKRPGKEIMIPDKAPAELPEDLPVGCKFNFNYRDPKNNKMVLLESVEQGEHGYCWTIVFPREVAAHLYNQNKVNKLVRFSEKHLFAHTEEKFDNGNLKHYRGLKIFLKESGMVLREDCKCVVGKTEENTTACDKLKDKKVFKIDEFVVVEGDKVDETELISLLQTKGPMAIELRVTRAYKSSVKDEIFFGAKGIKEVENHICLLNGIGTRDGIHYFDFQNTWGPDWGVGDGHGKFARKISLPKGSPSLVANYFYPKLLDQVFEV